MSDLGGRPLKFATPEALQEQINAYFDKQDLQEKGYTITGLALALDTSRETLCNYEKRDEYFDAIKRAKLRVEEFYESRLPLNNATGPIFALKNFGWADKQETKLTGDPDAPIVIKGIQITHVK